MYRYRQRQPPTMFAAVTLSCLLQATAAAAAAAGNAGPRLAVDCSATPAHGSLPSLEAARDALRARRTAADESAGVGGHAHPRATIEVRGRCSGPLTLSGPQDSGVSWLGVGPAAHTGGLQLPADKLRAVTDPAALALLPSTAAGAVKQMNLSALGLNASALGKLKPHHYPGGNAQINFYLFEGSGQAEAFWGGGEALHLARYPNSVDDQLLIPQNSMLIRSVHHGENGAETNSVSDSLGEDGRGVPVRGSAQLATWAVELAAGRQVWAHGEWSGNGWSDVHKPVTGVNASALTIDTVYAPPDPHNSEGRSSENGWFNVYGLVSELDSPGEYVIGDFGGSLLLLVYPPANGSSGSEEATASPTLSMVAGPVLHVHDAEGVTFAGIDIEYGKGWGAVFHNCTRCGVSDCRVRNFGINGVNVTGGEGFMLRNVEVTGTGQGGVIFEGGDRVSLTPGNHTLENCTIHRFARIMQKYTPGVCLTGVGHTLKDSSLFDGAHFGMLVAGNDMTIEGNHFHDLVYGGADAGAIYSGRDWTYRGQMITKNLFENISSYLCQPGGAKNCRGQAPRALHSDDGMSGWTVAYNHFRNVTQVHNAYSSRDITFMHNRIEHVLSNETLNENQLCAIHLDVMNKQCTHQLHFLHRVPYNCSDCSWAGKYPHLGPGFLQDEPWLPKYWRLENNTYCDISYDGYDNRPLIDGDFDRATFGVEKNNINSTACLHVKTDDVDSAVAAPSAAQLAWQEHTMLRTFHHFDMCTFTGCEHNSGTANSSDGSGPASAFNPTAINATQWVLAAKAMGAGSAVMTARHEGGFALWPSKFTNYSIANSPWKDGKGDIVMDFVTACRAHGITPGLYIAAGCDAFHHCGPQPEPVTSSAEYERLQNGMVEELVSGTYGVIEYLWFDHHGNPVNSTSPFGPECPHMCDPMSPTLWSSIDKTVKKYGGQTLRGGVDLNIGATDPPKGDAPLWMACNTTDGGPHTRPTSFGPLGQFYRPSEITNMLTSGGWFHHDGKTKPHSHNAALSMIWGSIGRGFAFIGNAPPNTHGVLDDGIVEMMTTAGASIRAFWGSEVGTATGMCTGSDDTVTLTLPAGAKPVRTVALRESLAAGQKVAAYTLEFKRGGGDDWEPVASRETIGRMFLHDLGNVTRLAAVRVRCTKLAALGANVTVSALGLAPLDA